MSRLFVLVSLLVASVQGITLLGPAASPVNTAAALRTTLEEALKDAEWHKRLSLLGSTGSIGTQTLDIVRERPDHFSIVGLAAGRNLELLADQIKEFGPEVVSIQDSEQIPELRSLCEERQVKQMPAFLAGEEGAVAVSTVASADTVVTGIVGCAGLIPTVAAIKAGKDIALANKETLISGGPVILPLLKETGVHMIPADSEHSAIFQCMQGLPPNGLRKIILTASGGAFRDWDAADLDKVTVADALKHPNWAMGAKITVDSATMMNKGLEVIEAHYLFGAGYDDIEVVVHPQSIMHSGVECEDTSVIAQLGWPDMRLPLLYSVSWPHRVRMKYNSLDFAKVGTMTFVEPDTKKYPCLPLAYAAGRTGGTMTAALNAANERANELFREEKIPYLGIPRVIESAMNAHANEVKKEGITLEDIIQVDEWARKHVDEASMTVAA